MNMAYKCGHCGQAHEYVESARLCSAVEQQEEIARKIQAERDMSEIEMYCDWEKARHL